MNKLNKLYEAMLKSWGCKFTEDKAIMLDFAGTEVPVKVDEKLVYLATSENLASVTIGKVFFHPACESIMSKETEIFKVIRKLTSARIYTIFQPIYEVLFSIASKKSGKTLSGKLLEQLEPFKNVTKAVKAEVTDVLKTMSITIEDQIIDTRIINFSLIKGGKTENDESIYYTATPSFPFYTEVYRVLSQNEHLKGSDRVTFNNMNVSVQALQVVIALFEIALPACIDPSLKKYSTTTQDAARLVAYLRSYGLVVADLNSLIGKFRKEFDSIGIYGIDIDFLEELDEISEIKRLIPALDYNNYNISSTVETPSTVSQGTRINSFNPLAGVVNTVSAQINGTQVQQQPAKTPNVPPTQPGETYLGVEYYPNNGIYEFKYQQNTGMVRIRCLAEDGRFISENFQMPGMNNMTNMAGVMNPLMGAINPMQLMNLMGSGIPMFGMGGGNGLVRDVYTGQLVAANNNNGNNSGGNNGTISWGSTGNDYGAGTVGINNI